MPLRPPAPRLFHRCDAPARAALAVFAACAAFAVFAGSAPLGADIYSRGDLETVAFGDAAVNNATPIRVMTTTPDLTFVNSSLLDTVHRELFVGRWGEVTVLDSRDSGATTALRTISGDQTGLGTVTGMALDLTRNLLYVSCYDTDDVRVFLRSDNGNVAPQRVLAGPNSTLESPEGLFLDLVHDELYVANSAVAVGGKSVTVFNLSSFQGSGTVDVAPVRRIAGAATTVDQPRGLAVDLDSDLLLVADRAGALDFFPRLATGNAVPTRRIAGGNTLISAAGEIQILDDGEVLIGTDGSLGRLVSHLFTSNGELPPVRTIEGASTGLAFAFTVASSRARDCSWGKSIDGCLFRDNFEGGNACDWSGAASAPACP